MTALAAIVAVVAAFGSGFILGGRLASRWAREDERAWARTIRRARALGGTCRECGNLKTPEPLP